MKVDTIIQEGWVVTLFNKIGHEVRILWGIVAEDNKHGWAKGTYACTSEIVGINGDIITTKNSTYQVLYTAELIRLPALVLDDLRKGTDPRVFLLMDENNPGWVDRIEAQLLEKYKHLI